MPSNVTRRRTSQGVRSPIDQWHQYRVPRPDRAFESYSDRWLMTSDTTASLRLDLLRRVNDAGRFDILREAADDWNLLAELVRTMG